MDLQALFHWIYVIAMAIGALYFISLGTNPRGVPKYEYLIATFIPIWSGLAYMAMALGQGKVEVAGQITHYARYIDWIVTTPLLLLSLSSTAMYFVAKDWTLIASLMGTQAIVVVSGLIADLSTSDEARFLWYTCGVVAFLVVLWGIWVPLRTKTRGQGVELSGLYDRLLTYFTVLWISYPIAWLIGPSGLGWVNQTIETLLFCVLPFFSKVGFSYLDLNGLRRLNSVRVRATTTSPKILY
ncbi:bacteriorhodopsin [Trichocoleus sp. FACHB-591]|uniref:bacteriorhodopsin n=1 Tax=Trichocoleus sp. FACHB-591 TaxID=2692872 RepID=UPI0016887713|nr:bacteriorhodopsin [Trichocoleus sp. FACHB-591]MBD2095534.1 bacteriorhodopsin [Trichocoleus sp. FACHB-591]